MHKVRPIQPTKAVINESDAQRFDNYAKQMKKTESIGMNKMREMMKEFRGQRQGKDAELKGCNENVRLSFIETAKRLPRRDGKIVLDRNNPDHVEWGEGYE
ncbi:hypothetical protein [Paenibacillus silvae]|uniref:Uncharacterized protein n=1 Tax=Paenibacillus silvae TaxID=1325358 RepID=A0A2W6NNP7_9BACL|nr:hypothetical protein [Paenibacillus silvae]PZT57451.1 hypothetical protein DN757_02000 [Paenibacillus silvae]